jgi:hypothetical protein
MSRSGGLPYHWKALLYRKERWRAHEQSTRFFLERWNPVEKELLLIGPSGGYSIPPGWLGRFDRIFAYEPDLLARKIFERRQGLKPVWLGRYFPFGKPGAFEHPAGAAVLFSNLLGQIEIRNVKKLGTWLEQELQGRSWASFHDALSGHGIDFDTEDSGRERALLPTMKRWIHVRNPGMRQIEVLSHDAPDLFASFKDLQYSYWQWTLTPEHTFLTEGVFPKRAPRAEDESC